MAPTKLHPLWYSPFIPLFFFVSSIVAGLSMVIFEGTLSHKVFSEKVEITHEHFDRITLGLGKGACVALATYFCIKVIGIAHGNHWDLLGTPMGFWFLVEMLGFVALPCVLFAVAVREGQTDDGALDSFLTVIGIVVNRVNVAVIAFNWDLPAEQRYVPSWMEFWISATLVTTLILIFRWVVNRMPVLHEHPEYRGAH